jgi:uncharacterized protein YggL (DUF469 family)
MIIEDIREFQEGFAQKYSYSRQVSKLQCEEFQEGFARKYSYSRQVSKLQCEEFQEGFALLKGDIKI